MRSEGLSQRKIVMTPWGIEPASFRLVARCVDPTASPVGTETERIYVLFLLVRIQRFQLMVSKDGVVNTFRPVIFEVFQSVHCV